MPSSTVKPADETSGRRGSKEAIALENGSRESVVNGVCFAIGRLVGLRRRRFKLVAWSEVLGPGTFTGGQIDFLPR